MHRREGSWTDNGYMCRTDRKCAGDKIVCLHETEHKLRKGWSTSWGGGGTAREGKCERER